MRPHSKVTTSATTVLSASSLVPCCRLVQPTALLGIAGGPVALVGMAVALVGEVVTLVGGPLALVGEVVALVGEVVAFVSGPLPSVGVVLHPVQGRGPLG